MSENEASNKQDLSKNIYLGEGSRSTRLDTLKDQYKDLLKGRDPDVLTYNPSGSFGGHIVHQGFPYISRPAEECLVCELMAGRQNSRAGLNSADKINNPLIAIPGSPGSGKSAFLANFPASAAFEEYCKGTHATTLSPVVSTFTFNSGMDECGLSPGLRTLFGAALAMGILSAEQTTWLEFSASFDGYKGLTVLQAVEVLRYVFGDDRRILIMVDELAKAVEVSGDKNDEQVMKQLGNVLNTFGDVDVVVSSLSPLYIEQLASARQRLVKHVVPTPLLQLGLGKDDCIVWAEQVIRDAGLNSTDPDLQFAQNLLRNIYLVHSGHPRALEMMKRKFQEGKINQRVIGELKRKPPTPINELLFNHLAVPLHVGVYTPSIAFKMTPQQIEKFVLSVPCALQVEDIEFRLLLERGTIFVQKLEDGPMFRVAVSALSLLDWIKSLPSPGPIPSATTNPPDPATTAVNFLVDKALSLLYWTIKGPHIPSEDTIPTATNPTDDCIKRCTFPSAGPRTDAAITLLGNLKNESPSLWWARFIEFTVCSRSFDESGTMRLEDVFGLSSGCLLMANITSPGPYRLAIKVAEMGEGFHALPDAELGVNMLTVYRDDGQSGFDGHVDIYDKQPFTGQIYGLNHFYLQMKIQFPQGGSGTAATEQTLAQTVSHTILNHIWRYHKGEEDDSSSVTMPPPDLSKVHVVLYNWAAGRDKDDPMKDAPKKDVLMCCYDGRSGIGDYRSPMERAASLVANGKSFGKLVPADFDDIVYGYIEHHFGTIHLVDGPTLEDWLLPSFLPFPHMIAALGLD